MRLSDRAIRQNSIRAIKQLFKVNPSQVDVFYSHKVHVYTTFILEREFKNSNVAKERRQCFKLISAWLNQSPDTFPLLFGQSVLSLVRNEEEYQLRFDAIDLLITMCSKAPGVAA